MYSCLLCSLFKHFVSSERKIQNTIISFFGILCVLLFNVFMNSEKTKWGITVALYYNIDLYYNNDLVDSVHVQKKMQAL